MQDAEDAELRRRAAAGESAAFEALFARYQQQVRLMAWRVCRRADWTDDLANETWCRAFRGRESYNADRPFLGWIAGILQNVRREFLRSHQTEPSAPKGRPGDPAAESLADPIGTDSLVEEAEMLIALNDCVERLAESDRQLIRLRFFENQTLRVVAQRLGIAEATVRENRLPAAMEKLQRCLRSKGLDGKFFSFSTAQGGADSQYPDEDVIP